MCVPVLECRVQWCGCGVVRVWLCGCSRLILLLLSGPLEHSSNLLTPVLYSYCTDSLHHSTHHHTNQLPLPTPSHFSSSLHDIDSFTLPAS